MEHFETSSTRTREVNLPTKAIVALLLAFAMLMCAPVLAFADTAKELKSGQSVTASASNSFFKYTATKDGRVAFVTGNDDTTYSYIELYKYENKTSRIDYSYNQEWSSPYNSRIIYKMKAGQTVYLSCEGPNDNGTWSYPVEAIADDHNLALARPYHNGDDNTAGTDKNGLPIFDLCLKASKGEKHLVQNKDFKIDSFKAIHLDSEVDIDGNWTDVDVDRNWKKDKPKESGSYFIKFVGTGNYKGSVIAQVDLRFNEDGSSECTEVESKEYGKWSNESSSTRSDIYATTANGENIQGSDFLNNPLAAVSAWINGAWKTLTEGTDYEFSKDDIAATDDPNWFQATIKGIGDWANNLETSFLFQVCDHKNLIEHPAVKSDCSKDIQGEIKHWECKDCGLFFADQNATSILWEHDDVYTGYDHQWGEWQVKQKPTCTEDGWEERTCKICEEYDYRYPKGLGKTEHTWGDWKTTEDPTCTNHGAKERICSVCGYAETKEIESKGHNVPSWKTVYESTSCSSWGKKIGTCSVCGEEVEDYFPGIPHNWGEWTIDEQPTCENYGERHHTCSTCESTEREQMDPIGHKWSNWNTTREPTCTDEGRKERKCSVCGETDTEYIDSLGKEHSWGNWVIDKQATCNEKGNKHRACSTCKDTEKETIKKLPHSWDEGKVTKEATCNEIGIKTYTCKTCGVTKTEGIPTESLHVWDSGQVTTPATCGKAGVKTYTCSTCGTTKTEAIPATGKHDYEAKVTKQATCTEDGVRTSTCRTCGDVKTEAVKATGHKWDKGEVTKQPTCATAGERTLRCTNANCKETKTESVPATGKHVEDKGAVTTPATCEKAGTRTFKCSTCGKALRTESIPATGHKFGDWKVVKAATENVKGSEERACSTCGKREVREVAALPASVRPGTSATVSGATVTVASTSATKTPSGAKAAGTVTYKRPANAKATSVTVPSTVKVQGKTYVVTKLDGNAFRNNKRVKAVKLPGTVTQVGGSAFSGCTALKSVSLPGVKTIGPSAFKGAKGLKSVTTGKGLKSIGSSAFSGAKGLKTLTVTSKSLTKKSVRGSLKGSSVKTVKVKVGSKKVNKTYVKKYKKVFTKSNCGKKVSVK